MPGLKVEIIRDEAASSALARDWWAL